MGGLSEEQVAGLAAMIPDNIALGVQQCRQQCGLTSDPVQPTAQQQPRVSGNALPSATAAVFVSPPAAPAATATASTSSTTAAAAGNLADPASLDAVSDSGSSGSGASSSSSSPDTQPILIALVVVNGILAAAVIAAVILYFLRNKRPQRDAGYFSHRYQGASKELPRCVPDFAHCFLLWSCAHLVLYLTGAMISTSP